MLFAIPIVVVMIANGKMKAKFQHIFLTFLGDFQHIFLSFLGDFLVKPGAYFMSTCGCRQKQPSQFPISRGIKNMAMGIKRSCAPCKSNPER